MNVVRQLKRVQRKAEFKKRGIRGIIGKRGTYGRRVLAEETERDGYSGVWDFHATKGWRKTHSTSLPKRGF